MKLTFVRRVGRRLLYRGSSSGHSVEVRLAPWTLKRPRRRVWDPAVNRKQIAVTLHLSGYRLWEGL